jgi:hypothetical protein
MDLFGIQWQVMDVEGLLWLVSHSIIGYALYRSLFSAYEVNNVELAGAIALYLLLGIVYANLYALVLWHHPEGLVSTTTPTVEYDQILYYSFMTQTTVGYGDVVPGNRIVRVLSVSQAITGVLYIAVFISWFVSTHSARHLNHLHSSKRDRHE